MTLGACCNKYESGTLILSSMGLEASTRPAITYEINQNPEILTE